MLGVEVVLTVSKVPCPFPASSELRGAGSGENVVLG